MEIFKILKLRDPMALYEQFTLSDRKPTLIINTHPSDNFVCRSSKIWNTISPKLKLNDFSFKISTTKNTLKTSLLRLQNSDPVAWISDNYSLDKISEK